MKILEVRDGFIKLEADKKNSLSSFLQINDVEKNYIAQIMQVKKSENGMVALAKILFLYDGTLKNYDKTLPNKSAEISEFTFDIINNTINYTTPVIAGKFIDGSTDILLDKDCFNKKMLISADTPKINNRILSNLVKQFSYLGKVVTIDMLGVVEGQKYVAGVDFKLPLNTDSLNFMYEDCLNDATADSKNLIKEIFTDLSEYSKTVSFLPFDVLKSIVDDMVDKQHVFKLLVLKNKLEKFSRQGYFAATAKESQNLAKILDEPNVVIDLSKLDVMFQNRYLETICSQLKDVKVFLEASNALNKKNIKNILVNDSFSSVFITHSRFKYINEIKSMFDNFIIEPSINNNEIFKIYSTFLTSMPKDTYLLVGEGTNYIPFVSSLDAVVNIPVKKEDLLEEKRDDLKEVETENLDTEEPVLDFEEELFQNDASQQEEILNDSELEVVEVSPTEQNLVLEDAIEQKADDLINKISKETLLNDTLNENNIFSDDEESYEVVEDSEIEETAVLDNNELVDSVEEDESELDVLDINESEPQIDVSDDIVQEPEIINECELIEDDETIEESESNIEKDLKSEFSEEFHTNIDEIQTVEVPDDISELADEIETEQIEQTDSEIEEPEIIDEIDDSALQRIDIDAEKVGFKEYTEAEETEQGVIPLNDAAEFDEILELDESDTENLDEETILVELEDETDEIIDNESLDKQIVEDVDKVFTTMKEESISDSDLDFIDELNNEGQAEELEELSVDQTLEELPEEFIEDDANGDEYLEPVDNTPLEEYQGLDSDDEILETKSSQTPIVPVYGADIPQEDIVMSDPIEQGDIVVHAKYGSGTVEKMIKYGTKTLFSINFDNVGRRLLDPTLTEIKKA